MFLFSGDTDLATDKFMAIRNNFFRVLRRTQRVIYEQLHFLSHLLIAGCDIGVQISVRPFVRSFVRPSVCPSTFTSKFGFLDIRDSCESETLHSNCP